MAAATLKETMSFWDLFTYKVSQMSSSLNFVHMFERMYDVYGIFT